MTSFSSSSPHPTPWQIGDRLFLWGQRTYLMGVLNITPDSFSDGGDFNNLDAALKQAQEMAAEGADLIDIGGQSTRPGAKEISLAEELERVIPVVEQLHRQLSIPISVDTTRAAVAEAAVAAGASIINDISAGIFDPQMLSVVAKLGIPIVLMHVRGTPQTMQKLTNYQDLIGEIYQFLASRVQAAIAAGINRHQIAIDPGIGFAKTGEQNLEILRRLPIFRSLECPILVGPSRKSFIGKILDRSEPKERVWGTAAACSAAIAGSADILRVHDIPEMRDVCQVADAIFREIN